MRGRIDPHAKYRELLAARLDRQLTRLELRSLNAHLKKCDACQLVDADYRAQRFLLRGLPAAMPPRDLWARTSASLDREVARAYRAQKWNRRLARHRRSAQPSTALMTAVAVIGVTAAIAVLQLGPTVTPTASIPGQPTPLAVTPQSLAIFGLGPNDAALYSTEVSQVCPPSAPDCVDNENLVKTPLQLPRSMRSSNAALSPSGKQLALVGRVAGQDVIAVVMMPADAQDGGSGVNPVRSTQPTDLQDGGLSDPAAQSAAAARSHQPTDTSQTGALPSDLIAAATPNGADITAGTSVLSILDNVQNVGAAPAWSQDGDTLAFSAMPVDGSTGPDVYIWSPGDDQAQAITSDHQSYFASWSNNRIVVSRVGANGRVHNSVIDPTTLEELPVIGPGLWLPAVNDQATEAVGWYGQLDTTGSVVTPEQGMLYVMNWAAVDPFAAGAPSDESSGDADSDDSVDNPTPAPTPTATTAPTATPSPTPTPTAAATPDATPTDSSTLKPHSSASADLTTNGRTPTPSPTSPNATASPTATPDVKPTATPAPTPTPAATPTDESNDDTAVPLIPLEPDRDPSAAPVLDWQVNWSSDGQVVGFWVADSLGSTWGRLAVVTVDPNTQAVATDSPLLPATLAKRGFSMGLDRVAWVAPSNTDVDGELRIRTWGTDGVGGLRLTAPDQEDVLPAF